jgi:endoglucanase
LQEQAKKLDICIYFVNSVQEEIGLRWAEMMAYRLQPDLAIITDVCHDTSTPMIDKKKQGDTRCGLWPVLSVWPAVQNKLRDFVEEIATKKKVPFQRHASSRSTWTDTDAFAYTKEWIASVLISLPLRYMHTTVEMVHQEDVENTIKLMFETVCAIKKGMKVKYL